MQEKTNQNTTVILVHKKSDSILENSPGIEDLCSKGITKYNQEQNQKGNLTDSVLAFSFAFKDFFVAREFA